ncbi:MAG: fatty acid CoA ligase family protein [Planctomycetota bacterium]|nr:fatty acid CoA ligase family protein [Planctomycetota bacterium]
MLNIADRLTRNAELNPFQRAVVFPAGRDSAGRVMYSHLTFQQLDNESNRLARGLVAMGVEPAERLVLAVRPSLEFIALTFAIFKAGATCVLIDPGMGRSNIFKCLQEVEPDGFVAIPLVHAIRCLNLWKFPRARHNVTVGRRLFWGGPTYQQLLESGHLNIALPPREATDPAAIIFTSGSTGPPKGVLYEHGMFDAQVDLLRDFYDIQPGEIDLPGFPLFALYNSAMGVTTVIPDMDPTRPANVDPTKIIEAINDQGVTQAFGSPALWNRVGRYCEQHAVKFPTLKRALSAGAPVPPHVIERVRNAMPTHGADIHTPYGATESLPVCSISGREVCEETRELSEQGRGTCVGRPFPRIDVRIIQITDGPIASITNTSQLATDEIGEIIVRSPAATRHYFRRPEATAAAKIPDGETFWHRMGDVGYIDESGRLWFCGRKSHIVPAASGRMFTIPCEAVFNNHPQVFRSALVGIGPSPQEPVIIVEPESGQFPRTTSAKEQMTEELLRLGQANPQTANIRRVLFHESLPVDTRHNVKIFREKLAPWAEQQLHITR